MFHDNLPESDPTSSTADPASIHTMPDSDSLDLTSPAARHNASPFGQRNAPGSNPGDDPLHFGEIDDVLELVADGETGVLDGPRTPPSEIDSLRRELQETRAELNRVKSSAGEAPAWLGLSLLGGNPAKKLQGTELAIAEKTRELKQLKMQIASAREVAREMDAAKAKVTQLEETRATLQQNIAELQNAEATFADRAKKLERLKEEETTLRESIDRLQRWVQRLQSDVDGYEAVIPMESEKLATCRRERDAVAAEIESGRAALSALLGELEVLQSRRDAQTSEVEAAQRDLNALVELRDSERVAAEVLTLQVTDLRSELATLRQETAEAEAARDAFRDQGDRLCVALQEVEAKQAAETKKLDELTAQVIQRTKDRAEAEASAEEARAALREIQDREQAERENLAKLQSECAAREAQLAGLQADLAAVELKRDAVLAEVTALRDSVNDLEEMRQLGSKELDTLDGTLARRREELTGLQAEILSKEEDARRARELVAQEQGRLDELNAKLAQSEAECSLCASEIEELRFSREKLVEEIEDATEDRVRLTKQCAAREDELASQRASLAELQTSFARLQAVANTREQELQAAEARLKSVTAEQERTIQAHTAQLDEVIAKVDEANTALEAITERVASEQARYEAIEADREQLLEQIAERGREQSELEAGIAQHREFLRGLEAQYRDLEASFQLRMDDLQSARNKAEDDLAAKVALLTATAAKVDDLQAQKCDLSDALADYERILALRDRATERLRRSEDRERELYDRIATLEKKAMSLRRA